MLRCDCPVSPKVYSSAILGWEGIACLLPRARSTPESTGAFPWFLFAFIKQLGEDRACDRLVLLSHETVQTAYC